MGRRITRKQLKGDDFVSTVDSFFHWLTDNWRPFAAGLAAVCILILLWWGVSRWTGSRTDAASYLLHQAMATAAGDEGLAGAETRLQEVIDRYGRTDQGDVARLYLANLRLEQGRDEEGRDLLLQVTEHQPQAPLGGLATLTLLQMRAQSGQAGEVAKELEPMAAGTDRRLPRDTALFELARIALEQNDTALAKTYYQKLVDDFPESPYLSIARQRLGELG